MAIIDNFLNRKCRFCGEKMELKGRRREGFNDLHWYCRKCNYKEYVIKY